MWHNEKTQSNNVWQQKWHNCHNKENVGHCLRFKREASNQAGKQKTFLIRQKHFTSTIMSSENILFLYHQDCSDGFLCRVIAHCFYERTHKSSLRTVHYHGVAPGSLDADLQYVLESLSSQGIKLSRIESFDVAMEGRHYAQMAAVCSDVQVFDHHESTWISVVGCNETNVCPHWLRFNQHHCGAYLAYMHFYGNAQKQLFVPEIIKYVQVRDLWLYNTDRDEPDSLNITTELYATWFALPLVRNVAEYEFFLLDETKRQLCTDRERLELFFQKLAQDGAARREQIDAQVKSLLLQKTPLTWYDGTRILFVESSHLQSEIGDRAIRDYQDAIDCVIIYRMVDGQIRMSLRSDSSRFNVNVFAKNWFGGGGHAGAAGARIVDLKQVEEFLALATVVEDSKQ